jgi:hypothetical protein
VAPNQQQTSQRFLIEKLNEVEGKETFYVEVINRFAVLEDLDAEMKFNGALETIRISNFSQRECRLL